MKKGTAEKLYFALIGLMFLCCLVFYIMGSSNKGVQFMYNEGDVRNLNSNWSLYNEKINKWEKVSVPGKYDIQPGKTMSIRKIITDISDDDIVCFRTDHTSVRAYVDGEVIYSFGWDEEIPMGKTPGSIWHRIKLKEEYEGKRLTIELNSPYGKYSGMIREIVLGKSGDVYLYVLKDSIPLFLLSFVPFILGLVMIIVFIIGVKDFRMKELLYLGLYLIINAIWGFTESRFMQFAVSNAFSLQMLNFVVFSMAPLGAVIALKSINLIRKHFTLVFSIVFGCVIAVVGLQVFGLFDFFETLFIVHISILLGSGIIFFDNYKDYKATNNDDFKYIFVAFTVLFISAVLDMVEFYTFDTLGNGFFFRIGSLVFTLILGMWAVNQGLTIHKEGVEREAYMKMAYTDNLTGLLNRRAFDNDLRDVELDKIKAFVVVIDLNNLKTINDKYGHQNGDAAIKFITDKIKIFKKAYGEKCYRTGGDEFCVICKKLTVNEIISICDEINNQLKDAKVVEGVTLSMAYGYKMFDPERYDTIEQIVSQADEMMYENKQKMKAVLLK